MSVAVGLQVAGFISSRLFFFGTQHLVRLCWGFYTCLRETQVIQAIKMLKASRIPHLTMRWDFTELMRHLPHSGQDVLPRKILVCWQLSQHLVINVFKMAVFERKGEVCHFLPIRVSLG